MDPKEVVSAAPSALEIGGSGATATYTLADDLIASHDGATASAVLTLEGGAIGVGPVDDVESRNVARAGPVYRHVPSGELAVPTGHVLVRFATGERAEDHETDLADAGFTIEEVLSYAPQAAWVRAASGEISDSLRRLDEVAAVRGVEHVEPQLVSEAHTRA